MQLYLPTGSHLSVVVVIHGGYWRSTYGMELAEPLGRDLTRYGVAAAVIEYRRVGEGGGWPTTLADVARAVDSLALQGQFVAEAGCNWTGWPRSATQRVVISPPGWPTADRCGRARPARSAQVNRMSRSSAR